MASWVKKQMRAPVVRSAPRFLVRPCPNSSGGILSTVTPDLPCDLDRSVSGPGVDDEHLIHTLALERGQELR